MKINLAKNLFTKEKVLLAEHGSFKITKFAYASGVEALEVENSKCSFIFTPFKGQQIWHFVAGGKELSMDVTTKEPTDSVMFLENYGGFLYHCGVNSFGVPDKDHPHHGEIPNAFYDEAYVDVSEDEKGMYIVLGGTLNAPERNYNFSPSIKLYDNTSMFEVNISIENTSSAPLEYMYLCHLNFRPFNGSEIITSAKYDKEHIKLYRGEGSKELVAYFDELEKDLTIMNKVGNDKEVYDPEICFAIQYEADEDGYGHTMQMMDDGACYVKHPTDILSNGVRWISRTDSTDALGMVLPATAEHVGYYNAKEKGQLKIIEANKTLGFTFYTGYVEKEEATKVKEKIKAILA